MEQDKFYDDMRHQIERIKRIEDSIKRKPTTKDLKETVKICKEFGFKININDIPDLHSVGALEKWRLKKIFEFLDSH